MARYTVTAPDGQRYEVTAPDGATQDEVLAYAQANYKQAEQPQQTQQSETRLQQIERAFRNAHAQGATEDAQRLADAYRRERDSATPGQPIRVEFPNGQQVEFPAGTDPDTMREASARYWREQGPQQAEPYRGKLSGAQQPDKMALTLEAERRGILPADRQALLDEARRRGLVEPYQGKVSGVQPPKRWRDVVASPEYQALQPDQQEAARAQYFTEVVAPNVPEGQLGEAHRQWEAATGHRAKPDFSNVRGGSRTTEVDFSNVRGGSASTEAPAYTGPTLAPSQFAADAPEAPTLREVNARNRAYRGSQQQTQVRARYEAGQAEAKQRAFQELPAPVRFGIGAGSRVAAAGRGIDQLAAQVVDYIAPRERGLSSLITGAQASRYDEAMRREAEARQRDRFMQGDAAATLGGIAGDVGLIALPAGAVTRAVGTSGRAALAGNVALGAGYAGFQPVVEGQSRAQNAAIGGAFGAGAHAIGAGVRALGRNAANAVPTEVQQMAQRAQGMGIPLHASQVSQSLPVKVAASAGKYLPFSGYAKAAGRQQEAVNRAVARTFGTDVPKLTDDVMHRARQDLSRQFDEIYNRNAVPIGETGARRLADIERTASRRLTNDEAQVLRNQLDDILGNAEDGVLTGQKYQAVRTALRKAEGNDKLGMAIRELRQALDDIAADAVGPQDSAALKALRSRWANFRTVEAALKQNAGAGGDVRLAALWPLIRKGSTKEMRELARMGQTMLKDPIADSGTAQRSLMYNVLMGGGSIANPALIPFIAKAAAGGATIGRAANSNTLARLLTRSNRGQPTSRLGQLLQGATPYAAPAGAAAYNRAGGR